MFKELESILDSTNVNLMISKADGQYKVFVLPQAKEGKNPALATPLCLTGSLEELDAKFASQVTSFSSERKNLEDTLESATAVMRAAGKKASDDANDKVRAKSTVKKATVAVASGEDNETDEALRASGVTPIVNSKETESCSEVELF